MREAQEDFGVVGGAPATGGLIRGVTKMQWVSYGTFLVLGFIILRTGAPFVGIGISAAGVLITTLLGYDASDGTGTLGQRLVNRLRWVARTSMGTNVFWPWSAEMEETLTSSKDRRALRGRPEFAEELMWVAKGKNRAGIAWHQPRGKKGTITVTFEIAGMIRGLGSIDEVNSAMRRWGNILGSMGGTSSLSTGVQVTTRVVPPEMAHHEGWLRENESPDAPSIVKESYEQLLKVCEQAGMTQRHFLTFTWPMTDAFYAAAARLGEREDGWQAIIDIEVANKRRALENAGFGPVHVLTARQTIAFVKHAQDPRRPLDQVDDIDDVEIMSLPYRDTFESNITTAHDGKKFFHSTGVIRSQDIASMPRALFWTNPLMRDFDTNMPRTITFHLQVVPAATMRKAVRDELIDSASEIRTAEKRAIPVSMDAEAALEKAQMHHDDLRPDTQQHGLKWVSYVTVTAENELELAYRKKLIEEVGSTNMGVEQVRWLNSYQAAAFGATLPFARGLAPAKRGGGKMAAAMKVGG